MLSLTPTPPRWIAASNAVRCIGSALEPASAPNSTALITLLVASASCAMSPWIRRLAASAAALQQRRGIDAAVGQRDLLGHRVDAVGRDDERGAVGRDQPALHRAACFHQLGGDHDVDVARHRRESQHRRAACSTARRSWETARRSSWSRRCAAPRPAPTSSARRSRNARRDRRSTPPARHRLRRPWRGSRW